MSVFELNANFNFINYVHDSKINIRHTVYFPKILLNVISFETAIVSYF